MAFTVKDVRTLPAHDDARAAGAKRLVICEGMQMVESIKLSQLRGLILIRHRNLQQSVTRGPFNQRWKLA
jgi:hypothetical protein